MHHLPAAPPAMSTLLGGRLYSESTCGMDGIILLCTREKTNSEAHPRHLEARVCRKSYVVSEEFATITLTAKVQNAHTLSIGGTYQVPRC